MKIKIYDLFKENIKDIKEELKFLVFIDHYFPELKWYWYDKIKCIIEDKFDTHEALINRGEIIKKFNKKSEFEKAIELLNKEADIIIKNIVSEIKMVFYNKEFNEKEIKRLEHIIMKKRFGDIDYDTAVDLVSQILSQKILNDKNEFNASLFSKKKKKRIKNLIKIMKKK